MSIDELFRIVRAKTMWIKGFAHALNEDQRKSLVREADDLNQLLNKFENHQREVVHDEH